MKITMRAATVIAAAGALGFGVLGAGSALAGTKTGVVTAVTHASNHIDTTSVNGPLGACQYTNYGPVWALDNLSRQFAVTSNGGGNYTVVVTDRGSFSGFADPANCSKLASSGSISGTYTLYVVSPTGPNPSKLPAQESTTASTTDMVQLLFGGKATSITGGDYYFSYQNGNYVQSSQPPYVTGDVTGH
jgi:hypothetical protein